MSTFQIPSRELHLRPLPPLPRGKPRDFVEWSALRRWGKLPEGERDVAGYMLRLAREEANLTQASLARALGVSQQSIAQAERWTSNPTIGLIKKWAEACGQKITINLEPVDKNR